MGRFVIMLWSYGAGIWTSVRFGADTVSWGFYLDFLLRFGWRFGDVLVTSQLVYSQL